MLPKLQCSTTYIFRFKDNQGLEGRVEQRREAARQATSCSPIGTFTKWCSKLFSLWYEIISFQSKVKHMFPLRHSALLWEKRWNFYTHPIQSKWWEGAKVFKRHRRRAMASSIASSRKSKGCEDEEQGGSSKWKVVENPIQWYCMICIDKDKLS